MLVALHGGGLHAGYFHGQAHPDLSLLQLGHHLGYSVAALDRPGYGSSGGSPEHATTLGAQSEILTAVLHRWGQSGDVGGGIVLVGHSFGSMVAMQIAATMTDNAIPLRGLAISGVGVNFAKIVNAQLAADDSTNLPETMPRGRLMHWGDERWYPDGTFDRGVRPHFAIPATEPAEARNWPHVVATVAQKVAVPVHLTFAEHEPNWISGPEGLKDFERLFTGAPFVDSTLQRTAGHNLSLGWAARSYHLKVVAFADDCLNYNAVRL
ncbi:alpha/beta hydrolase [Rhodococcoides fascians]|uniref:alpha/beta hydrolase n=1 Tax=Rhodococcoides fascians TaxID=1828 RepID=UPI001E3BFC3E|nr:alpha/beta fold hydrolase [Rhodococcus fascians]